MVHVLAKVATASGLAAAAATPFTLSAFAGTTPSVPGVPAAVNVGAVTSQVSGAVADVTSSLGLHSVPVSAASLPGVPGVPGVPGLPGLPGLPGGSSGSSGTSSAPNASASGDAVSVPLLDTCVSCTSADAGQNTADGNSIALRVLGQNLSAGQASGNGSHAGNLIALPANPLLNLAIADWMAAAQAGSTSSNASSRASLVDLDLGNGQVATLAVLEAGSNASWTAASSNGNAYSNGVHLNLGNGALVLILLHSDADSSAGQHAYVASINGTSILSSSQLGSLPPITIPGVVTITLLQTSADGGLSVGSVATAGGLLGMPGQQLGLITTSGQGASNNGGSNNSGSGVQAANTGSEFGSLGTPETGIGMGILGFLLVAGGAAAALTSRIRRQGRSA